MRAKISELKEIKEIKEILDFRKKFDGKFASTSHKIKFARFLELAASLRVVFKAYEVKVYEETDYVSIRIPKNYHDL